MRMIRLGTTFLAILAAALLGSTTARALPLNLELVDINPDDSGPIDGWCPAPCAGGGSGGRVHNLASSSGQPTHVYAASELGGLFRSLDGGQSWSHLDGFLPTKAWDVEVDPAGTRVYATSFYDGRVDSLAGISVSGDGGLSWEKPATAAPPPALCGPDRRTHPSAFGLAIRPGAPNEVFAGTNCGLARSTDSGATWSFFDAAPGDADAQTVWDVVALPGGRTYACGQEGVMRSDDGVNGWHKVTTPDDGSGPYTGYCSIAAVPAYPDYVFVVLSRVVGFDPIVDIRQTSYFASFDGGTSWTAMPHPDGANQKRVPMVATNPRSYGFDVWVGAGNLFRIPCITGIAFICPITDTPSWQGTYTDGASDPQQAHGDSGDVLFDPTVAVDARPLLYSSDGGVYVNLNTSNPAAQDPDFASANTGLHAELLLGIAQSGRDVYFATQDIGAFGARNNAATPPSWTHGYGGDAFDVVADATQALAYLWTNDPKQRLFIGEPGFATDPIVVFNAPTPAQQLYTVFTDIVDRWGRGDYVLGTRNGAGVSDVVETRNLTIPAVQSSSVQWTSTDWPVEAGIPCGVWAARPPVGVRGPVRYYALSGDCIWRNRNELWAHTRGVPGWEQLDVNTECPSGGVGIFAVDEARPNRLYASCIQADTATMIRSNDGGATWQTDTQLTDLLNGSGAFEAHYPDVGDGATFGGVQPAMVAFDPTDKDLLLAGGYDSGLFISSDNGQTWSLLTDPDTPQATGIPHLPRPFYASFDHPADMAFPRAIFVGTVGRGLWRIRPAGVRIKLHQVIKRFGRKPVCIGCPVRPGNLLSYISRVVNPSDGNAGNPVFRQELRRGLTFESLESPRGWTCTTPAFGDGGEVSCRGSELAAHTAASFVVKARVAGTRGGSVLSVSRLGSNGIDLSPKNNRQAAKNPVR